MPSAGSTEHNKFFQATVAVQGAERPSEQTSGEVLSPVCHFSTFAFQNLAEMRRHAGGQFPEVYFYSRNASPTAVEDIVTDRSRARSLDKI